MKASGGKTVHEKRLSSIDTTNIDRKIKSIDEAPSKHQKQTGKQINTDLQLEHSVNELWKLKTGNYGNLYPPSKKKRKEHQKR